MIPKQGSHGQGGGQGATARRAIGGTPSGKRSLFRYDQRIELGFGAVRVELQLLVAIVKSLIPRTWNQVQWKVSHTLTVPIASDALSPKMKSLMIIRRKTEEAYS